MVAFKTRDIQHDQIDQLHEEFISTCMVYVFVLWSMTDTKNYGNLFFINVYSVAGQLLNLIQGHLINDAHYIYGCGPGGYHGNV